jgi:hypothetical protein
MARRWRSTTKIVLLLFKKLGANSLGVFCFKLEAQFPNEGSPPPYFVR